MSPPTLERLAALHLLALDAQDASPNTHSLYRHVLGLYRRWVSEQVGKPATVAHLTPEWVRRWAGWLVETDRSASTARNYQRIVKTHSKWLVGEDILPDDPLRAVRIRRQKVKEPKVVTDDELARIIAACQATMQPLRNKAIVLLLADSAIRVSGLCGLDVSDLTMPSGKAQDGRARIRLKGGDERSYPFGRKTAHALSNYLQLERPELVTPIQPLFLARHGGRITVKAVERLMRDMANKADVQDKHTSPHGLRHYAGTAMAAQGLNAWQVRDRLGHKSLETSSLYVHLAQRDADYRSALDEAKAIDPRLLKPPAARPGRPKSNPDHGGRP